MILYEDFDIEFRHPPPNAFWKVGVKCKWPWSKGLKRSTLETVGSHNLLLTFVKYMSAIYVCYFQ